MSKLCKRLLFSTDSLTVPFIFEDITVVSLIDVATGFDKVFKLSLGLMAP